MKSSLINSCKNWGSSNFDLYKVFCNDTCRKDLLHFNKNYTVKCNSCNYRSSICKTKETAIQLWNYGQVFTAINDTMFELFRVTLKIGNCPSCGSYDDVNFYKIQHYRNPEYVIMCLGCRARSLVDKSSDLVVDYWNSRVFSKDPIPNTYIAVPINCRVVDSAVRKTKPNSGGNSEYDYLKQKLQEYEIRLAELEKKVEKCCEDGQQTLEDMYRWPYVSK